MLKRLYNYINPFAHLGDTRYSLLFPFVITMLASILLEIYSNNIVHDPNAVGLFAIFIFITLIIYFSFREGLRGGLIATTITICYYFYIIYSRHYTGEQLSSGIDTTIILGILYVILASVIGILKQTIDKLIEKEADERKRLETIIQQLPVGVLITDEKGKIMRENKQVEIILGTKFPADYTFGKDSLLKGMRDGKEVSPSQSPIAHVLSTGRPITNKEILVLRKDGKKSHIQVSASVVRNNSGKVIAAAEIITDITEQKQLEQRKDDFVNMASHELKTPITSMKLYIDLLMRLIKQHNDDKSVKMLVSIKEQTERLQKLVSDLLDVSRLQTGKLTYSKERFNITELVHETAEGLEGTTKQQKITIIGKAQVYVYGDKFRIYQVITNLITNAVKYSPEKADIIINIKKDEEKVIISVQDYGLGVSKSEQKRIFERLYQVDDDKEKTFPGFGMGLYISKEIIKRHKGNIWVESEKGKGSIFSFTLPLFK